MTHINDDCVTVFDCVRNIFRAGLTQRTLAKAKPMPTRLHALPSLRLFRLLKDRRQSVLPNVTHSTAPCNTA